MQTKATVSWQPVKAKDNDGRVPQMTVYPSYIPPSATSYDFPEGSRYLTYTAKDTSGNTATCSFRITVQGLSDTWAISVSAVMKLYTYMSFSFEFSSALCYCLSSYEW